MQLFRFLPGLRKNWKAVILSIMGAAAFWFFNAMDKSYDTRLDYPLTYSFERDSVVVVEPLATKIKIDVASGGWNLIRKTLRINATPIEIKLENPDEIKFLPRASLIPLISDQLDGLKLTYLVTDTLFFNIEQKITKKLPVTLDSLAIPLSLSYRLISKINCNTDSVIVSGPKSVMEEMANHVKIKFTETNIDNDFDDEVGFEIERHVTTVPKEAIVKFKISKFLSKEITIQMERLNFPDDSSVYMTTEDITLYYTIDENDEDDVDESDFSVTADYAMYSLSDSTISPLLMYAHEKALDIVLAVDRIKLLYPETSLE